MTRPLRLGLIGVDSPHAPAFTRILHESPEAGISGAWPGEPTRDLPLSVDRFDGFIEELRGLGVSTTDDLDELSELSDAFLMVAVDFRHREQLLARLLPYGKPVYVDTRFAPDLAAADRMIAAAAQSGVVLLGGSPKRFAAEFRAASSGMPAPRGIDLDGPMPLQPPFSRAAWYGVHMIDLAVAVLGVGCRRVVAVQGDHQVLRLEWDDGRVATIRGSEQWHPVTRGRIAYDAGMEQFEITAGESMLRGLLDSVATACRERLPNVGMDQLRETVAIVAAAERAGGSGAAEVDRLSAADPSTKTRTHEI